jgi:hypothetical protein
MDLRRASEEEHDGLNLAEIFEKKKKKNRGDRRIWPRQENKLSTEGQGGRETK